MWTLETLLYDGDYDSPGFIERLTPKVSNIQIVCALHGGVSSVAISLAENMEDAFEFALRNIGRRIFIVDNDLQAVAEGTIVRPTISEGSNDFVCWGPYDRLCFAQVYQDLTSWISSGTTTGVLKDMLTDECPGVNSDQTEITETATNIFPFQFKDFSYPGEIIPQLAAMSDFQNLTYDFWLRSLDPTPGAAPKKPQAYFKIRSTQVSPHYEARSSNFASGGVRITPDITRLVNSLRVLYTNSAGATAQTGGASDADSQSDFWLRELFKLTIGRATETAAEQYRDSYIGRFADVQQTISFEVNGWLQRLVKRTEDQFGGGREPLWKAVADFPVGFRWLGAPPERIPVSGSWGLDGRILFWTSALTYDYASNMLTIQPDTEPREFENIISRLQRMGGIA